MIAYLTRDELNVVKYVTCISNAVNTRVYAYSWFLDIVCDTWDVLVEDDYQSVMPLPKRKKYGIYYIYQPPWIQQLGVFSLQTIKEFTVPQFLKKIPKKFKLVDIFLNSKNLMSSQRIKTRENFILSLDKTYETLRKQYSKGRKSSCNQAQQFNLEIIENYDYEKIIQLFKQNKGTELNKNYSDYQILSNLITHALCLNYVKSMGVINKNNELIGGAFFLKDKHRITYLFSAVNDEGREKQAMSFLIDHVIENNAESDYILDFEGSMIAKLASFFKSFGTQKETYFHLKKYRI